MFIMDSSTPRPPVNKKHLRMYGHNLCPFAERTRLAFAAKGVKFQKVEVNLASKTQWHLDINGGTIPILETPEGKTAHDSLVLMEMAEEMFKDSGYHIYPTDHFEKANMKLATGKYLSPLQSQATTFARSQCQDKEAQASLTATLKNLEAFLGKSKTQFTFGTKDPQILDFQIYSILRQLILSEGKALDFCSALNMRQY
mmetsp:Transcript_20235/g.14935  ORF Transcript_20235/g.14935 Transcript_20235/m.14935 type:complete len:199 (-) Transcript_20235:214-810(-)|eukprot:CAMPEP_0202964602 /NCGR_PEP_ID=MMETSP1396-20130829/8681_1 /ASSEMBLY_ACC=CAM_ASM_000872 /TAXON_ID= /ORGANISM="Pseudokeronopsis sp., Strain Brazil" /LENGTH=198 /DNA_ID=CAMNT_0049686825 /DNA_START=158 /DNA_END=754 /DNA_ORIENTATION=+